MKRVLIIGGYGNFGSFISRRLAGVSNLHIIIAGRSEKKAQLLAREINAAAIALDIHDNLDTCLRETQPDIVIHTSGPFQSQGYSVAEACIEFGAHYIDLADGRDFVANINVLDNKARQAGVLVVSGASSVPCLTSALIDHYQQEFEQLQSIDYGITTAQQTARGLATTAAILSYTGKSFKTRIDGEAKEIYGWQGLRARKYPELGWRLLGYCNIPDLELFPKLYPNIKTIKFYAGLEIPFIHLALWLLSWLVRARLIGNLQRSAPILLKLSFLFDWLGSSNSGFHMELQGTDKHGESKSVRFELTARDGDGPYIPCMPAILLAEKLANQELTATGATPCIGLITRDEYLDALGKLNISWTES